MESKGKRRDRKIGFWLSGILVWLLLMAYAPLMEKVYNDLSSKNTNGQVVRGLIRDASASTEKTIEAKSAKTQKCAYTIKSGDTLTSIARRANDTIGGIAKRNDIKNIDIIRIGQVIILEMDSAPSSDMAMSKASSEKFIGHAGASQKKPFTKTLEKRKQNVSRTHNKKHIDRSIDSTHANCALVGARIRNKADRLIARAECIRTHYGDIIKDAVASQGNLFSPLEILAIMIQESQGNPHAVSKADVPCLGLMQLQPPTAKQYGVRKIFDPRENIFGGVRVFTDYVHRYGGGNKSYGLAAYNMGPTGLRNSGLAPEQVTYVREVKAILRTLESRQFTL